MVSDSVLWAVWGRGADAELVTVLGFEVGEDGGGELVDVAIEQGSGVVGDAVTSGVAEDGVVDDLDDGGRRRSSAKSRYVDGVGMAISSIRWARGGLAT